jgi:hypothetical protein
LFGDWESSEPEPRVEEEIYPEEAEVAAAAEAVPAETPPPQPAPATKPATKPAAKPVAKPAPKATRVALRDNVPERYTVKKGDTLWDISTLFLKDPWLWPEIWYFNPQIDNPHLIYPGDVLALVYIDGQPQLRVVRDGQTIPDTTATTTATTSATTTPATPRGPVAPSGLRSQNLSPRIRREGLEKAIPTIPVSMIEPFLIKPRVVTKRELARAPYVVNSLDRHLATAEGNIIYVRNLKSDEDVRYNIFRPGSALKDPKTGKLLGYETILVSEAKLLRGGDPATLEITRSLRETLNGDRILPSEDGRISYNFIPREPKNKVEGQIISMVDTLFQTAQRQVVIVNLGERQGMEIGTVLGIDQRGEVVDDPYANEGFLPVKLPDERTGLLMIFRVFEHVSYGLIMESARPVHLHDFVRNPVATADID